MNAPATWQPLPAHLREDAAQNPNSILLETSPDIQERILTPHDLRSADRIHICNSLRGLREAILHNPRACA